MEMALLCYKVMRLGVKIHQMELKLNNQNNDVKIYV